MGGGTVRYCVELDTAAAAEEQFTSASFTTLHMCPILDTRPFKLPSAFPNSSSASAKPAGII
jgi:hypothetical protein